MYKRTVRKILRFVHFGRHEDPLNYWREQVMLFLPWRDEKEDLLDNNPERIAYLNREKIQENSLPYWAKANREIDEEMINNAWEEAEQQDFEVIDEDWTEADEEIRLQMEEDNALVEAGESETIISKKSESFLPPRMIEEDLYVDIMRTLNDKQRRYVLNTLHLLKTSAKPFYSFFSGAAGVGKCRVITAIVQSTMRHFRKFASRTPKDVFTLVTAFTGKAVSCLMFTE
jgi:predicted AAA+ superfamily ATPase